MNLLVNGTSGFVGTNILTGLREKYNVSTVSLRKVKPKDVNLTGIDCILHLSGKAHSMKEIDPKIYYDINTVHAMDFAQNAKESGVKHFIYISSVKVYGESSESYFNEDSICNPTDDYGKSKLKAEQELKTLESENFTISIIRPPLIYGKGVKGNLKKLHSLISRFRFLPFAKIANQRSMVNVQNLRALIECIIDKKAQGIFIAGDQKPYSTSELVNEIIKVSKSNCRNIKIPFLATIIKSVRPKMYMRLFESYIVDNSKTNEILDFKPPYSLTEGITSLIN